MLNTRNHGKFVSHCFSWIIHAGLSKKEEAHWLKYHWINLKKGTPMQDSKKLNGIIFDLIIEELKVVYVNSTSFLASKFI